MIKNFKNWLNEDFAQVGVAPAGNVVGMGDVVAPSSSGVGSGDAWPSLADPYSLVPLKKKKRKKRKKRKVNESQVWLDNKKNSTDSFFLLLARAGDDNIDVNDWISDFDSYYGGAYEMWSVVFMKPKLKSLFSTGNYNFEDFSCQIEDGEFAYEDDEAEALHNELKNNWKLFDEDEHDSGPTYWLNAIYYKEFEPSEKAKLYSHLFDYLKTEGKNLSNEEYLFLFKFLSPEEQHKLRGTSTGKKFNL